MPARDPVTGQFVAGQAAGEWDDIEVVTFDGHFGITAANLSGGTGFSGQSFGALDEGVTVVDFDEVVDRNEEVVLLYAEHHLSAFVNSTETADGNAEVTAEISSSPATSQVGQARGPTSSVTSNGTTYNVSGDDDDTIDLVGRPMRCVAHAPFSDGASGVGGGGSEGVDWAYVYQPPAEFGRFHPRDELFLNADIQAWNIDDAGVHGQVGGQHVYGVVEDP